MYDSSKMEKAIELFLEAIGEDPSRDGLKETPTRVAKMYASLLGGYGAHPIAELKMFQREPNPDNSIVFVGDAPFFSFCEHHMMPFVGRAHLAYVPGEHVLGLSKLVRMMRTYCKRLQIQERLTEQIADALMLVPDCRGSMVMLEAEHYCMTFRGVRSPGTMTRTMAWRGVFKDPAYQADFHKLIGGNR